MTRVASDNHEVRDLMTKTDIDLVGNSIHTDDSVSKFVRKDGSPIKNSQIHQTKGFAPSEFNKHTFGKNITLKYNNTKFRPDFSIAPSQDKDAAATSIIDQSMQQEASLMDSILWPS